MTSPRVIVDQREKASGVPGILRELGARVELRLLDIGDYVVGERAIERKTISDFSSSLFSGRLFEQANRLADSYVDPFIVVEGDLQAFLREVARPRIFWGSLMVLVLQYNIRPFFTPDAQQTAELIFTYATQLSDSKRRVPPIIIKKPRISTDTQAQLLVVGTLSTIGSKLAVRLLERFGTIRRIFAASQNELAVRGGIGRSRAQKITSIIDLPYRDVDRSARQSTLRPEE